MARYFKYKTPEALERDARERGLSVRVSEDLSPLLEPIRVAGRTIGNRMAIHPMEGCDGTLDGRPGELTLRRYDRFGAGGAKLIWAEATAVVPEGRANPRQLLIDPERAPGLREMLERCRDAHARAFGNADDLLVGLQLTHSGRYSQPTPVRVVNHPTLDPRTRLDASRMLDDDDLARLADAYVAAARLARAIGYDFVDLKQCHGYLLNELLGARARPGPHGGSYENRTRFVKDLVRRLRAEIPDLILATRINVYDGVPHRHGGPEHDDRGIPDPHETPYRAGWGIDPDNPAEPDPAEPIRLIGELAELGVSLVNVTLGNPYANPHHGRPFEYPPPDGYQPPEFPLVGVDRHFRLAEAVQRAHPNLAVVGTGYSWLQEFALMAGAANLRDGRVSIVGLGRAALSHPDFARTVMNGERLDRKRVCRTFSTCTALMRSKHNELGQFPAGCPPFDKAVYGPIWERAQNTAPAKVETKTS